MAILTFEQIKQANDTKPTIVAVPEWGGDVNVYPLTSRELDEMERWLDNNPAMVGYRLKLLTLALKDYEPEQVKELADRSGAAVKRLTEAAASLCEVKREEQAGNFDGGSDDASG